MHTCIDVYMYIYIHAHVHLQIHMQIHRHMYILHAYEYAFINVCTYTPTCRYVHVRVYMQTGLWSKSSSDSVGNAVDALIITWLP